MRRPCCPTAALMLAQLAVLVATVVIYHNFQPASAEQIVIPAVRETSHVGDIAVV